MQVTLRPAKAYHYFRPRNVRWMNDPEVIQFLSTRARFTMQQGWRYFRAHQAEGDIMWAIYADGQHVGNCGLFEIKDHSGQLRIAIGERSVWGKGIGKEVMRLFIDQSRALGFKSIWLHVNPDNERAVRLYKKVGFQEVGRETVTGAPEQLKMVLPLAVVVLADGCIDPLHEGHVAYLEAAKALGTKLIVNTVTDAEIWQKRPKIGPFLPFASRQIVIQGLRSVDEVVTMDTLDALQTVHPDIYAKGQDWAGRLPEAEQNLCRELGIKIEYLDTVKNSSTKLLNQFLEQVKQHQ